MAKNNVADYSTTAASNTDVGGISIAEGMAPSNVNNAARETMAQSKKWWNDIGAQVTVGGTANAITITSSSVYQSLVSGIRFAAKPSADNTGATTLNLDSLGVKAVRKIVGGTDVALVGGEILNGVRAEFLYDSTANAASGAWILLNPQTASAATGFATTATAAGTTTLTNVSARYQEFTGTTTQTIVLPVVSTYSAAGNGTFTIINQSTGIVTVQSSGANTIIALMPKSAVTLTNNAITGTGASVWDILGPSGIGIDLGAVGQVRFPAAQNASSDANTLDDYEEGTWTPGIMFNGSAAGVTYTTQSGNYIKIGQLAYVSGRIILTNNGSGVGIARLTGLPFTSVTSTPFGGLTVTYYTNFASVTGQPVCYVDPNATTAVFVMSGAAAIANMTDTNITNTADFYFFGVYQTAA